MVVEWRIIRRPAPGRRVTRTHTPYARACACARRTETAEGAERSAEGAEEAPGGGGLGGGPHVEFRTVHHADTKEGRKGTKCSAPGLISGSSTRSRRRGEPQRTPRARSDGKDSPHPSLIRPVDAREMRVGCQPPTSSLAILASFAVSPFASFRAVPSCLRGEIRQYARSESSRRYRSRSSVSRLTSGICRPRMMRSLTGVSSSSGSPSQTTTLAIFPGSSEP